MLFRKEKKHEANESINRAKGLAMNVGKGAFLGASSSLSRVKDFTKREGILFTILFFTLIIFSLAVIFIGVKFVFILTNIS